jgi:hypothetical protein
MTKEFTESESNPFKRAAQRRIDRVRAAEREEEQRRQAAARTSVRDNRPTAAGGTRLDPVTAELKAKSDAAIAARHQAAPAARQQNPEDEGQTAGVLVEAFEAQHPETFSYSEFNKLQFIHLYLHRVSQGLRVWSMRSLEATHQELLSGDPYGYEKQTRTRGEKAVRPVPPWRAPAPEPERVSIAESIKRNRMEIPADEAARLRSMPLDDLRKQVRSGYKEDPRNRITRI